MSAPARDCVDSFKIKPIDVTDSVTSQGKGVSKDCDNNWKNSSLISGEGLLDLSGIDKESVEGEIHKIHQENVALLSNMTKEEIALEQSKIKERLGNTKAIAFVFAAITLLYRA